jgi:hypothetical protein
LPSHADTAAAVEKLFPIVVPATGKQTSAKPGAAVQLVTLRPFRSTDAAAMLINGNNYRTGLFLRDIFPFPYTQSDAEYWIAENNIAAIIAKVEAAQVALSERVPKLEARALARRQATDKQKAAEAAAKPQTDQKAPAASASAAPASTAPDAAAAPLGFGSIDLKTPLSVLDGLHLAVCVDDEVVGGISAMPTESDTSARHRFEVRIWPALCPFSSVV